MIDTNRKTGGNSTYPKVAIQWLNQALCFYQSLYLVDSEVPSFGVGSAYVVLKARLCLANQDTNPCSV